MERRLAAIMATDVVGYSRLFRADEEGRRSRPSNRKAALDEAIDKAIRACVVRRKTGIGDAEI